MRRWPRGPAMVDPATSRNLLGQLSFVLVALGVIFVQLLPLTTAPRIWTPPDVLLLAALAWVVRRPDYLPVWLVAAVFLLTDFLFHRPPGLFAALMVLLTEALRRRASGLWTAPFLMEWLAVSVGIAAVTLGNRMVLSIAMTPQAPLGLTLIQMGMSILFYPVIVLAAAVALGITRPTPGEAETPSGRIW